MQRYQRQEKQAKTSSGDNMLHEACAAATGCRALPLGGIGDPGRRLSRPRLRSPGGSWQRRNGGGRGERLVLLRVPLGRRRGGRAGAAAGGGSGAGAPREAELELRGGGGGRRAGPGAAAGCGGGGAAAGLPGRAALRDARAAAAGGRAGSLARRHRPGRAAGRPPGLAEGAAGGGGGGDRAAAGARRLRGPPAALLHRAARRPPGAPVAAGPGARAAAGGRRGALLLGRRQVSPGAGGAGLRGGAGPSALPSLRRHGQLGHGDLESRREPRAVEALQGLAVAEAAAGGWHSAAVSDAGDLYLWGWNEAGQLGLPSKKAGEAAAAAAAAAQEPGSAPRNRSLCGRSVASGSDGLQAGAADGSGGDEAPFVSVQPFPALLDLPEEAEVRRVSCGSRHTAAVTGAGQLYTWGWGKYGQLGHQDRATSDWPRRVCYFVERNLRVQDVVCGPWTTFVQAAAAKSGP